MPFIAMKLELMLITPIVKKKEISTQYDSPNTVVCSDQNVDTTNGIDISLLEVNKCKNCATLKLKNRSLMHKVGICNKLLTLSEIFFYSILSASWYLEK